VPWDETNRKGETEKKKRPIEKVETLLIGAESTTSGESRKRHAQRG